MTDTKPETNITPEAVRTFQGVIESAGDGLALFSAFLDEHPVSVLVAMRETELGTCVSPLFIYVDDALLKRIKDHHGEAPAARNDDGSLVSESEESEKSHVV